MYIVPRGTFKAFHAIPVLDAEPEVLKVFLLDADAALGGLEPVCLRLALGGVVPVGRLPIQLITRAVVKRRVRVDPRLKTASPPVRSLLHCGVRAT